MDWLSAPIAADSAATWQALLGPLLVMIGGVAAAAVTARSTLRASMQANALAERRRADDRDAQIDARAQREVELLAARCDRAEQGLDTWRSRYYEIAERYQLLRLGVIALGHDPDEVSMPRPRRPHDDSPPAPLAPR